MRIISPPRHGGKASVWRNRSAIPRARRALFRFGHVGSFCQTPPCRRVRTGRASSAERRIVIHCYFSLLFIVICAGGDAGRSAQSRAAQAKFAAGSSARIVISLLLTMPRCGSAAHDHRAAAHNVRPQGGRAAPLRARCWPASSPGSVPSSSRCQTARSARWRQCVFVPRAASLRAPRGTVGPRDRVRKTISNANLSSIITLRSQ